MKTIVVIFLAISAVSVRGFAKSEVGPNGNTKEQTAKAKAVKIVDDEKDERPVRLQTLKLGRDDKFDIGGCSCLVGDLLFVKTDYEGGNYIVNIDGDHRMLPLSPDGGMLKSGITVEDDKYRLTLRCDQFTTEVKGCKSEEGCTETSEVCDIDVSTKEGKRKNSYKKLEGNCGC